jgi:hypothetical protein
VRYGVAGRGPGLRCSMRGGGGTLVRYGVAVRAARMRYKVRGGQWGTVQHEGRAAGVRYRTVARAGSKEEARLQDIILGEILDTKPSVRWDDVAGLAAAKQVPLSTLLLLLVFLFIFYLFLFTRSVGKDCPLF